MKTRPAAHQPDLPRPVGPYDHHRSSRDPIPPRRRIDPSWPTLPGRASLASSPPITNSVRGPARPSAGRSTSTRSGMCYPPHPGGGTCRTTSPPAGQRRTNTPSAGGATEPGRRRRHRLVSSRCALQPHLYSPARVTVGEFAKSPGTGMGTGQRARRHLDPTDLAASRYPQFPVGGNVNGCQRGRHGVARGRF
jgi:hypothetical protein